MSMTLILWKAPVVDDPDEAEELTRPWYEIEDDGAFEPSADIAIVANELGGAGRGATSPTKRRSRG